MVREKDLRRLRYLLQKQERKMKTGRLMKFSEALEVIGLKGMCQMQISDLEMAYLALNELLWKVTTSEMTDEERAIWTES